MKIIVPFLLTIVILAYFADHMMVKIKIINIQRNNILKNHTNNSTYNDDDDDDDENKIFNNVLWPKIQNELCPDYKPNIRLAQQVLFRLATDELNITRTYFNNNRTTQMRSHHHMRSIFYVGPYEEGQICHQFPNSTNYMMYERIWKGGNNQIREFLDSVFGKPIDCNNVRMSTKKQPACYVTAIRDPISHFLSAYNEIEHRWFYMNNSTNKLAALTPWKRISNTLPYLKAKVGSEERFVLFVQNMLNPEFSNEFSHWQYDHLKSMSCILANNQQRPSAYLPSLANLTYTFPSFLYDNCPGLPPSIGKQPMPLLGQHNSSADQLNTYKAARGAWAEKSSVANNAMDYACWRDLPDGVPKLCQEVFSNDHFVQTILNETYRRRGYRILS